MRTIGKIVLWVVIVAVVGFIAFAFLRARPEKKSAPPPVLTDAPARVYGRIEPEGGDVYVSSPVTRAVTSIAVREGDQIRKGQVLCVLDNSVEQADADVAQTNIATAEKALAVSRDVWQRNQALYDKGGITEYELTQSRLKAELDQARLDVAVKQAEQSTAQLARLELRAPVSGRVYRFDVRLGQTLTAGDNSLILLGSDSLMARMYVESYWSKRIHVGKQYLVRDAETGDTVGTGEVTYAAPYLGRRNFRTDDPQERLDTDYQEVVLSFRDLARPVPIGLKVVAELTGD